MLPTRKISDSIANPIFFEDPSRLISEALGREFMYEIGAIAIHRIGLLRGIGWRIPYGMASHGLSYCRMTKSRTGIGCLVEFAKLPISIYERQNMAGEEAFAWNRTVEAAVEQMEFVRSIDKVPLGQLREVYMRETVVDVPAQ